MGLTIGIAAVVCASWTFAVAQPVGTAPAASRSPLKPAAEQGARWQELKPAQQEALRPLEHEWPRIEGGRKQKWLELSARFKKMSPDEQARVQERMAAWTRLTPLQRGAARLHFQQVKQMPAAERQARWEAYQTLSPEQKQEFAARAGRPAPFVAEAARRPAPVGSASPDPTLHHGPASGPPPTSGPRVIGPTIVQAQPGVTTSSITKRSSTRPRPHPGLPPIGTTPGLVNKATLLPQRAAASGRPAAAAASAAAPHL